MFNNSKIFVSGATGSWGQTLISLLLKNYDVAEIVCFSRGELQQVLMQRKFKNPKLKFVIGDIRDYDAVKNATNVLTIFFILQHLNMFLFVK
jgi:UDP-N-acetylglucosamine 4,6-dehydratase